MDFTGRLRSLGASRECPCARFLGAGCKEGLQAEQLVPCLDYAAETRFHESEFGEIFCAVLFRHADQFAFDGC